MYSLYDTWGFPCVFPHSEISGSLAMCAYPKLIAAYHVLHRLLMPRHSPCALCSLTYFVWLLSLLLRQFRLLTHVRKYYSFSTLLPCSTRTNLIIKSSSNLQSIFQSFAFNITKNISWLTSQYVLKLYIIIHMQFSKNKFLWEIMCFLKIEQKCLVKAVSSVVRSKHLASSFLHRKEVIQPQVLLRLPCYDFTPIADPTLGRFLPCGLDHVLWVLPTLMVWRAVCTRPGNVFTATCWFAITSNSSFM